MLALRAVSAVDVGAPRSGPLGARAPHELARFPRELDVVTTGSRSYGSRINQAHQMRRRIAHFAIEYQLVDEALPTPPAVANRYSSRTRRSRCMPQLRLADPGVTTHFTPSKAHHSAGTPCSAARAPRTSVDHPEHPPRLRRQFVQRPAQRSCASRLASPMSATVTSTYSTGSPWSIMVRIGRCC